MYAHGVRCTDCHAAHTAKLKLAGNAVCLQCHASRLTPLGAAGNYDTQRITSTSPAVRRAMRRLPHAECDLRRPCAA
jgi:predicted CXXCH cytochrome family protein